MTDSGHVTLHKLGRPHVRYGVFSAVLGSTRLSGNHGADAPQVRRRRAADVGIWHSRALLSRLPAWLKLKELRTPVEDTGSAGSRRALTHIYRRHRRHRFTQGIRRAQSGDILASSYPERGDP